MRTLIINFRASELEKEFLEKLAKKHGVTPSEFLRDLLRNMARQNDLLPELDQAAGLDQPESVAA
jgi:hypothetical protein